MEYQPKRVLFIEDEPSRNEWLVILIENAGYDLKIVDLDEGWHLLQTDLPYNLVMIDIIMPVGNLLKRQGIRETEMGLKLYEKIRSELFEKTKNSKFLIYSMLPRHKANIGTNMPFIRKDADPQTLLKKIKDLIGDPYDGQ